MKKIKGIKKYARQFLNTVDLNEVPVAIEQLGTISALMEKDRNFRNLMISPAFSEKERHDIIAFLSQKMGISEKTKKFLIYISDAGIAGAMSDIVRHIAALYLDMKKKAKAVVVCPVAVEKEYEKKLVSALSQITGRDIDVEFVIDPSLLGGVRIKVGSTMYDSSIRGQLGLLRDRLLGS